MGEMLFLGVYASGLEMLMRIVIGDWLLLPGYTHLFVTSMA